jgi:hypothetical protein
MVASTLARSSYARRTETGPAGFRCASRDAASSFTTPATATAPNTPATDSELADHDENGVDPSQVRYSLSLTPTERLKTIDNFMNAMASVRPVPPPSADSAESHGGLRSRATARVLSEERIAYIIVGGCGCAPRSPGPHARRRHLYRLEGDNVARFERALARLHAVARGDLLRSAKATS